VKSDTDSHQLPNTYLRQFFRFLGGSPALLEGTEQSPESLARLDGRNSFKDYCRFFINAREQLDEPAIGLVLGQVNQLANMHGALSVAVLQSTDIRDCLELLLRFIPLRNPAFRTSWQEDEKEIGMEFVFLESAGEARIPVTETLLLSLTSVIAVASQRRVTPSRIELDYPRPAYADRYRDAFQADSFRFSSTGLRLLVTREDGDFRTGTDSDPSLRASAIQRCEELLRGVLGELSTSDRVRQILADNPGHLWTLRDIAGHLNTSERTLQRRLAGEFTSYQKMHDQWLQNEAQKLLLERKLSIESIAMLLGYSDVSNLRHACRRWFGKSPQAQREWLLKQRATPSPAH
jgi:AraC-like DNA-binding protein